MSKTKGVIFYNTQYMQSETIVVTQNAAGVVYSNSSLTYTIPGVYKVENRLIGLRSANLYKSWRNITAAYNNSSFGYNFNGTVYPVAMPDGNYAFSDLSAFFTQVQINNGHYLLDSNGNQITFISLALNLTYYSLTLTCTPIPTALTGVYAGYTNPKGITLSGNCPLLIVPNTAFTTYIGYAAGTYPAVTQTTTYFTNSTVAPQVDIVTNIFVLCSLANSSSNSYLPGIIGQLSPTTATYGAQLTFIPSNITYYDAPNNSSVTTITIRFVDQFGLPLNIYDPSGMSVTLDLLKKKSN